MNNKQIANILREIGLILEFDGVAFKPRAYGRAAQSIEFLGEEIAEIYRKGGQKALNEIPGVGKSIAGHIAELVETGKMKYYQQLKKNSG